MMRCATCTSCTTPRMVTSHTSRASATRFRSFSMKFRLVMTSRFLQIRGWMQWQPAVSIKVSAIVLTAAFGLSVSCITLSMIEYLLYWSFDQETHQEMTYTNVTSLYFATPFAFNAPDGGAPETISIKFCTEARGWPGYTVVKKYCGKFWPPEWGAQMLRTTDEFAIAKTRT